MISAGMISGVEEAKKVESGGTTSGVNLTLSGLDLSKAPADVQKEAWPLLMDVLKSSANAPLYAMGSGIINNITNAIATGTIASMQFETQTKIAGMAREVKEDDNRTSITLAGIVSDMNKKTTASNNRTTVDVERIRGSRAVEIAQIHDKGETERANLAKVDDIFNSRPSYPNNGWPVANT